MRIVGGRLRGRALVAPKGNATRPTTDRVRESLFNILEHGIDGFSLRDTRVVDLFAGSGALGLEALSRGARYALFVETAVDARATLRENSVTLGLGGATRILKRDAANLGAVASRAEFDLAFLDPPYGKGLGEQALQSLDRDVWLVPGAIVVAEEAKATPTVLPPAFAELDRRGYGDTVITIARYGAAD